MYMERQTIFFVKAFLPPFHHPPNLLCIYCHNRHCVILHMITDDHRRSYAIKIDQNVCSYVHFLNAKANILVISTLRKKGIFTPPPPTPRKFYVYIFITDTVWYYPWSQMIAGDHRWSNLTKMYVPMYTFSMPRQSQIITDNCPVIW